MNWPSSPRAAPIPCCSSAVKPQRSVSVSASSTGRYASVGHRRDRYVYRRSWPGLDQTPNFSGSVQSWLLWVQLQVLQLSHTCSEKISHTSSRNGGLWEGPEMPTSSGLLH